MFFFFHETIAYLKGNSKIKEKCFQENSYTEIRKTYFLAPKIGGRLIHGIDLYTGKYGNYLPFKGSISARTFFACQFTVTSGPSR